MTKNVDKQDQTDDRPAYDPPRALSLSDMDTGTGGDPECGLPGSGADGDCGTGLVAVSGCLISGSSAIFFNKLRSLGMSRGGERSRKRHTLSL